MATFNIVVQWDDLPLSIDPVAIERVIEVTLEMEGQPPGTAVCCTLVDDEEIQALNRQYRGVDAPTDVLAFAALEGEPLVLAPDAPRELGDIVISWETAIRQANALGHPVEAELALLAAHGCLHLLGYDHDDAASQAAMWQRQASVLAACGYPDVGASRPEMNDAEI